MSKFETGDRGARGYFLPEDGEFRLRKLGQHMEFLSRLAEPRTDEDEDGPEIEAPALAGCLELLAEQVQQVLDTVSWPARREVKGKPVTANVDGEAVEGAGGSGEYGEAQGTGTGDVAAAGRDDVAFGMTLDQLDEANRLLGLLGAQGDLLMAGGGGDFADGTLPLIGAAIRDGAQAAQAIIRQVKSQPPGARGGARVREMPAVYGPVARALPTGVAVAAASPWRHPARLAQARGEMRVH